MESYDTLLDFCISIYSELEENSKTTLSVIIHGETLNFHCYKVSKDFEFDSAAKVSSLFSLCTSADTYTQIILGFNISIKSGITLIPPYRCKGLVIFDIGKFTNEGIVSMSARGAAGSGQNIYLSFEDNNYEFIPALGASGGAGVKMGVTANNGSAGSNRKTGGGGGGGNGGTGTSSLSGAGSSGTSYSGGSGGGGWYHTSSDTGGTLTARNGIAGGAGGKGTVRSNGYTTHAHGGVGLPGGAGAYMSSGTTVTTGNATAAPTGTGGLLIIYAKDFNNKGTITANGVTANTTYTTKRSRDAGGGASGGGSINYFYKILSNKGTITANGGSKGSVYASEYGVLGGNGGNGSITGMLIKKSFYPLSLFKDPPNSNIKTYDSGAWQDI